MAYAAGSSFTAPDLSALPRVAAVITLVHAWTNRYARQASRPELGTSPDDEAMLLLPALTFGTRDLARETGRMVRTVVFPVAAGEASAQVPPWLGPVAEAVWKSGDVARPLTMLSEARLAQYSDVATPGGAASEGRAPTHFALIAGQDGPEIVLRPVPEEAGEVFLVAALTTGLSADDGTLGTAGPSGAELSVLFPGELVKALAHYVCADWFEVCGDGRAAEDHRQAYDRQLALHRHSVRRPVAARVPYRPLG